MTNLLRTWQSSVAPFNGETRGQMTKTQQSIVTNQRRKEPQINKQRYDKWKRQYVEQDVSHTKCGQRGRKEDKGAGGSGENV